MLLLTAHRYVPSRGLLSVSENLPTADVGERWVGAAPQPLARHPVARAKLVSITRARRVNVDTFAIVNQILRVTGHRPVEAAKRNRDGIDRYPAGAALKSEGSDAL